LLNKYLFKAFFKKITTQTKSSVQKKAFAIQTIMYKRKLCTVRCQAQQQNTKYNPKHSK